GGYELWWWGGGVEGGGVGGKGESVSQLRPVPLECSRDDQVGQVGVLRQQAAVQVGAEHVAAGDALAAVAAIVAGPLQHPAQRAHPLAQERPPAVVLEADKRGWFEAERLVSPNHHVADASSAAGDGVRVDQTDPRPPLAGRSLVVMAE